MVHRQKGQVVIILKEASFENIYKRKEIMLDKIKSILGSVRFWQLVIAAIVVILGQNDVISVELANTIAKVLGVSITIGTLDSVATKMK